MLRAIGGGRSSRKMGKGRRLRAQFRWPAPQRLWEPGMEYLGTAPCQ
jgi:hypothetical protein